MHISDERMDYGMFRVLRRPDGSLWSLGKGAMGVTYRAVNTSLDSPVALKVIDIESGIRPEDEKRFVCEARAMAGMRHKHIASVYHLAREEGQFFYAMELINGDTAQEFVERCGPMAVDAALRVTSQVCQALAAAERHQLVHRDVKPANIMILTDVDEDEWPFVKLIDFGLVRSLSANREASYATLPGFVGTAQFASPEQIREERVDARADIYSLGCTLWYLLTGAPPFEGSIGNVFTQHLHAEPPWKRLHAVPKPVIRILRGALQKDPSLRPNAVQMRREIEECLAALSRPPKQPKRPSWWNDSWQRWALVAASVVVLLFVAFGTGVKKPDKPESREAAMLAAQFPPSEQPPAPPAPAWEYLATAYSDFALLQTSRPVRLSKTPVPSLGVPGGGSWLDGDGLAELDMLEGRWTLSDPTLLARSWDVELNDAPEPTRVAKKPARRATEERAAGFSPRREVDRARRVVENTLRRFF